MNKRFLGFMFCFCFVMSIALGQEVTSSSYVANRNTALRFLKISQNSALKSEWESVIYQANLGLTYDDNISDLWYLMAIAKNNMNYKKKEVLDDVQKAIDCNQWVNYNRDNARVVYADLLCDVTLYDKAIEILDASPFIYSSDAEYIRIKAYYKKGDRKSLDTARNKIDGARRIYSDDPRFPVLFFKNEDSFSDNPDVKRLSNAFVQYVLDHEKKGINLDKELEIYSAIFASGDNKTIILEAFNAKGATHPFYAIEALKAGLMTQEKSFEYIKNFFDDEIDFALLTEYLSNITDKDTIELIREYFASFEGTIKRDTNGDGIEDLWLVYERGRPSYARYDQNQDGFIDWVIECDYGAPVKCADYDNNVEYIWSTYPYLETIKQNKSDDFYLYRLLPNALEFNLVDISSFDVLSNLTGSNFYIFDIEGSESSLSMDSVLLETQSIRVPSRERNGAEIVFNILNGNIYNADYFENGFIYAKCQFDGNGNPLYRNIDNDKDGIYETTEIYAVDEQISLNVHSFEDERNIVSNIFGSESNFVNCYLKMVQIDSNGDSIPDFTEEYLSGGAKICSWDTDSDNKWNIKYISYPDNDSFNKKESYLCYSPIDGSLITIDYAGGEPVMFSAGDISSAIIKDSSFDMYWIGTALGSETAKKSLETYNKKNDNNVCTVIECENYRIMFVNMAGKVFADIISDTFTED